MNRSFKISLKELVTEKIKAFEIDLETNPLLKANFNSLTTDVKVTRLFFLFIYMWCNT